jgi:phosphoglycerate dehydrogenase-like enzyme
MKVVVIGVPGAPHLEVLRQLPAGTEVTVGRDADEIGPAIGEAEVLVNSGHHAGVLESLFVRAPRLRWVHSLSAGVEAVVFPALKASPVPLTNARGVYKRSLGEFAIFAMLWFAKDAMRLVRQKRARVWEQFDCRELTGETCAVLSYGAMGEEVGRRAAAMGMKVIATRRRLDQPVNDFVSAVLPPERTAEAMSQARYTVCCSPLTPETRGMIGEREFAAMPPDGVFINIGRGQVVDEPAMVHALKSQQIKGAGLDVFETEPLPESSPLWDLDNVLLSPHCTDHTATWQHESVEFFVENFRRFVANQPLMNMVDKEAGY